MKNRNYFWQRISQRKPGIEMSSSQLPLLTGLFFICSVASANEPLHSLGEQVESTPMRNAGSLHLEVEQAPLEQIFKIIEDQTGIRIHAPLMTSKLVTATCTGTTLRVLKCLLGREVNLIYQYSDTSSAGNSMPLLTDVWVLNLDPGKRQRMKSAPICSTDGNETISKGRIATLDLGKDETESLLRLAQSVSPMERRQAVSRLVFADQAYNDEVREALKDALQDQNAGVRAQAVSGLARRNSPEIESVLREALNDGDAGVRLMAVSNAGRNIYLLQSALNDSSRVVRDLARMKLDKISGMNSDRPGTGQ